MKECYKRWSCPRTSQSLYYTRMYCVKQTVLELPRKGSKSWATEFYTPCIQPDFEVLVSWLTHLGSLCHSPTLKPEFFWLIPTCPPKLQYLILQVAFPDLQAWFCCPLLRSHIALCSDSQQGVKVPHPQGTFGNVWRHFWLSQLAWEQATIGICWVKGKNTLEHPIIHRKPSLHHSQELRSLKCQEGWGWGTLPSNDFSHQLSLLL